MRGACLSETTVCLHTSATLLRDVASQRARNACFAHAKSKTCGMGNCGRRNKRLPRHSRLCMASVVHSVLSKLTSTLVEHATLPALIFLICRPKVIHDASTTATQTQPTSKAGYIQVYHGTIASDLAGYQTTLYPQQPVGKRRKSEASEANDFFNKPFCRAGSLPRDANPMIRDRSEEKAPDCSLNPTLSGI